MDTGARTPIGASGNFQIIMSSFVHQMWTCQQLILILPKMNKIKKNYQIEELFKNQNCILEAVNGRLETINEKLDEGQINEIQETELCEAQMG